MPQKYVVEQGDFLSSIAVKFGFTSYRTIWDDGRNAALKQKRKTPSILFPGDVLIIPDKAPKVEGRATDRAHAFAVPRERVRLQIRLKDAEDKKISNAKFVLNLPGKSVAGDADGNGLIKEEFVAGQSHVGDITLVSDEGSFDVQVGIKIGDLNPLDEPSGQMARLNNLGYFAGTQATGELMDQRKAGAPVEIDEKADLKFRSAVEEFQCDNKLAVDGKCGTQTQTKLKDVYGC